MRKIETFKKENLNLGLHIISKKGIIKIWYNISKLVYNSKVINSNDNAQLS